MAVHIRELFVFPIKSAAAVALNEVQIGPRGPLWDRHWMIVDKDGTFITQREEGRLTQIQPFLREGQWWAQIAGGKSLPMAHSGDNRRKVKIWRDEIMAWDCGPQWSESLTAEFGRQMHLVEMPISDERWVNNKLIVNPQPIGFADAEPLLVVNQESVTEVEQRMAVSLGTLRFRPNIVVAGLAPFAETQAQRWRTPAGNFYFSKLCSRCVVITLDPSTGQKQHPTLLKEISKDQLIDGKIRFGVHLIREAVNPQSLWTLKVGDEFAPQGP